MANMSLLNSLNQLNYGAGSPVDYIGQAQSTGDWRKDIASSNEALRLNQLQEAIGRGLLPQEVQFYKQQFAANPEISISELRQKMQEGTTKVAADDAKKLSNLPKMPEYFTLGGKQYKNPLYGQDDTYSSGILSGRPVEVMTGPNQGYLVYSSGKGQDIYGDPTKTWGSYNAEFIPDWNARLAEAGQGSWADVVGSAALAAMGAEMFAPMFGTTGPLSGVSDWFSNLGTAASNAGELGAMSSTAATQNPLYGQMVDAGLIGNADAALTSTLPFSTTAELSSIPWGVSPSLYSAATDSSWLSNILGNNNLTNALSSALQSFGQSPQVSGIPYSGSQTMPVSGVSNSVVSPNSQAQMLETPSLQLQSPMQDQVDYGRIGWIDPTSANDLFTASGSTWNPMAAALRGR